MSTVQTSTDKALFKKRISEARIGNPQAQYEVGFMYANGSGTGRNVDEALVWFKAAAGKGHAAAQYLLAIAYANGVGTDKDEFQAIQWFFKAADQGNEKALLKLAKRLAEHHDAFAFRCCLKAAEKGLPEAQYEIAGHFARGAGVPRNERQAREWYEKAAKKGVARAQYALASLLGAAPCAPGPEAIADNEDALRWYRAASGQGHPGAQLVLARLDGTGQGRAKTGKRRGRKADAEDRRSTDNRWSRFAENGDADDRYHLGVLYETGIEVEKDLDEARLWYQKAALQQHREAQVALARMCESGGSAADQDLAFHWWQQAALQGSAEAQYVLGRRYAAGEGAAPEPLKSLSWHMRAADQGHPEALMAVCAVLTGGAEKVAEACFRKAAEHGHAHAQFVTGQRFASGDGVETSPDQAHEWFDRAARQGNADAQCALGAWYAEGQGRDPDFVLAQDWYERAAQQGHVKAQWLLGGLYATGAAGVPRDAKQAAQWCKKAAAAGFAPAQATLGTLFAQAKKMDRAVPWWAKAAVQGDPEAQFNLANAYRAGTGVKADYRTAFLLWTNAAAAGVPAAQTRLGLAYARGEGAALDNIEATKWFLVAQSAGDVAASANCRHAQSLLSPVQLAEARWRADEWMRVSKHPRRRLPSGSADDKRPLSH